MVANVRFSQLCFRPSQFCGSAMGDHVQQLYDRLLAAAANHSDGEVLKSTDDFFTDNFFEKSRNVLHSDPILIRLNPPLIVVGDIHGQFYDLYRFLRLGGPFADNKYLFLGDFVDRGPNSLEVITFLLCAKLLFPENVYLLRGNHETEDISECYGFKDECERRFGTMGTMLWRQFNGVFKELPLCAVVGERVFCVHGGISRDAGVVATTVVEERFPRPLDVGEEGIVTDFLWADPSLDDPGFQESDRGASFTFGTAATGEFLAKNGFDLIVRAHQVVKEGYEFPFTGRTVVTVFSCPNYCGECENDGAMLIIGEDLECKFKIVYWNEDRTSFDARCETELGNQAAQKIARSLTPATLPTRTFWQETPSSSSSEEEDEGNKNESISPDHSSSDSDE
jgi:serine/threonine-protein phosphatase PP1 catalytic subunit